MKNILITGVTGFVGSSLVKYFAGSTEFSLVGYSREIEKAKLSFKEYPVKIINDCSSSKLNELQIDCIIHLAGIAHDLSNQYKPEDYYQVNYEGTKKIMKEFLNSNASKFIFVSSIKAAVDIATESLTESIAANPITDYGKSKLMAEEYIQSAPLNGNKKAYIFRPCMIHGPGNKGNLNVLYRFVKLGLPYPFAAFENKRSFLSIDNFNFIAQSFIEQDIEPGIYNLADDGFMSSNDLYKLISKQLGKKPRSWKISKRLIRSFFSVFGKRKLLNKLIENMVVSNNKLTDALGKGLPEDIESGLINTIRSFNGN